MKSARARPRGFHAVFTMFSRHFHEKGCGGAARLHTPSYTVIQASHVSTGTTNNALALNPSGGNVGVGTTAPQAPLNTIGNTSLSGGYPTNTVALFQAAASAGVSDAGIMIGSVNGNTPYLSDYGSGSTGMSFYTNKVERMRISAAGSVGIGTTTPLTSFHILNSTSNPVSPPDSGETTGHILLRNTKTGASPYSMTIGVDQTTGAGYINAAGNGAIQPVCLQTRGGNVGIGTTNPLTKLHIVGSGGGGSPLRLVSDVAGNEVGIGFYRNPDQTTPAGGDVWFAGVNGFGAGDRNFVFGTSGAGNVMTMLATGSIGINTTTPSARLHITGPVANASVLQCWMTTSQVLAVTTTGNSANASWNATDTVLRVSRDTGSGRSINAGGTINANGADYAEYMTKDSDFSAQKGDILGVLPSGKLTNQFDAAIHFLLKSTNPCMVGGDVWGTEAIVGEKPKNPEESATEEEKAAHAVALAAWEARLEAERQKVDRMAFAGQVPVNILGATPGNYIIPLRNADGSIGVAAVSSADMSFSQYQSAVGRVISILADGRANVIVKAV